MRSTWTRRTVTRSIVGLGAGGFAVGRFAGLAAQDATPAGGIQPLGYGSLRIREVADASFRPEVNEIVVSEFAPVVQALDGYAGYLLGDVIDNGAQNVSVVVLQEESQVEGFNAAAEEFVAGLDPKFAVETPVSAEGEILMAAAPGTATATPAATPLAEGALTTGYVAVRIHTSLPGTDPREFVPSAIEGFIPLIDVLPGFLGYLWFPSEGGFTAISLYDSEASAQESTAAATDWAVEHLSAYTDGNPIVINATIVYADLPILDTLAD